MPNALLIIPIKGGFVLVEEPLPGQVVVDRLQGVVGDSYNHQLMDAVSAWRTKVLLSNTPPETA